MDKEISPSAGDKFKELSKASFFALISQALDKTFYPHPNAMLDSLFLSI